MALRSIDLMIGDYVLYQGHPNRVYRILPGTVPFADIGRVKEDLLHIVWNGGRNDVHDQVNVQDVEPIPLTPEILEKNGFKNEGYFAKLDIEDFHVLCDTKNVAIFHNEHTDVDIPIMYVHELQHALRLCGIEKEITI